MNLFLHNIGDIDSDTSISPNDSLIAASSTQYDYVLVIRLLVKKAV
jgi:type I restriction enzyme M protein